VVEKITGVPPARTVPDPVVRAADEIELVDVAPDVLRDRIARGHLYPPGQAQAALAGGFGTGALSALRELALLWLAASLAQDRQRYRPGGHADDGRPARERVMVALTGGPEGQVLIRRAARIAARSGADLLAVHITRPGGPAGAVAIALAAQRQLTESIGGTYHQLPDLDIPAALLIVARTENATQMVLGRRHRSGLAALRPKPRIRSRVIRGAGGTDVHIVTHQPLTWPVREKSRSLVPNGPGFTIPANPKSLERRKPMTGSPATWPGDSVTAVHALGDVTAWPWRSPGPGQASDRDTWKRVIRQALCTDSSLDADEWFPVSAETRSARGEAAAAIAICQACPVRRQCLALSLRHWDVGQHGVWGGLVTGERTRLRRRMLTDRDGALRYFTDAAGCQTD
jgi:hypothetical protein